MFLPEHSCSGPLFAFCGHFSLQACISKFLFHAGCTQWLSFSLSPAWSLTHPLCLFLLQKVLFSPAALGLTLGLISLISYQPPEPLMGWVTSLPSLLPSLISLALET